MANTIGVGVIGAGNIAEMNHLPGYQVLGITLQILDAIYESSKTGQMVDIT
jgi:predicted dehydrogenase